jgi:hypothetical protein
MSPRKVHIRSQGWSCPDSKNRSGDRIVRELDDFCQGDAGPGHGSRVESSALSTSVSLDIVTVSGTVRPALPTTRRRATRIAE